MAVAGRTSANAGRLGGERSLGGPGMVLALHYADLFCVQASRFEGVTLRHYRLRYMAFKIGKLAVCHEGAGQHGGVFGQQGLR